MTALRRPPHWGSVEAASSRSETISRADSLGQTRYQRVGKGRSRRRARCEADGRTRPDRGRVQDGARRLPEEIGHTAAMSSDVEDELRHLILWSRA
jgi:hypothetical protein